MTTLCVDDHLIPLAYFDSHGELSDACIRVVLKCFHLAQSDGQMLFGLHPLWQRSVTKCKKACSVYSKGCSARSKYFNRPEDYRHIVMCGRTLHVCKHGLFPDTSITSDVPHFETTSGDTLCVFFRNSYFGADFFDVQDSNTFD